MTFGFRHKAQAGSDGSQKDSAGGKIGLTLFFFIFFAAGMFFEVFIIREVLQNVARRTWPKVPCVILESSVQDDSGNNEPYQFAVKYQYSYEGITWQSDRYQFQKNGFGDYQKAQQLVDAYPADSEAVCYVNAKNPSEAILGHSSLWLALFILLPAVFILIGGGGIYGIWFYKEKKGPAGLPASKPKGKTRKSGLGIILFGFIFFAAGIGISFPLLFRPLWNTVAARSWAEVPCKIISARILSHDSDDGTTYSVDILYEYFFEDKLYRSNRYDFVGGSSSGHGGKQAIVDRYRSMGHSSCYVNPQDPSYAVLVRKLTWKNAIGLFPLIFVLAGLAVMISGIKNFKNRSGQQWLPGTANRPYNETVYHQGYYTGSDGDKVVLKPHLPPISKFLGVLIFCLFWNGIVSIFVVEMISGFRSGRPQWCLTLFLIPFELVGIGTIVGVVYQFMALFNPRIAMTISPGNLYPGTEVQLDWTIRGRAGRIRSLSIKLIGREEATYRRGTDTCTDKKAFFEKELIKTTVLHEISAGQVRISIPQATIHSFEAENNKIKWLLQIRGDIARWPDVSQEYQIRILPGAIG